MKTQKEKEKDINKIVQNNEDLNKIEMNKKRNNNKRKRKRDGNIDNAEDMENNIKNDTKKQKSTITQNKRRNKKYNLDEKKNKKVSSRNQRKSILSSENNDSIDYEYPMDNRISCDRPSIDTNNVDTTNSRNDKKKRKIRQTPNSRVRQESPQQTRESQNTPLTSNPEQDHNARPTVYTSYLYTVSLENSNNFNFTIEVPSLPENRRIQNILNSLLVNTRPSRIFIDFLAQFFIPTKDVANEEELNKIEIRKYSSEIDSNTDECVICLQKYKEEEDIRILKCNHYYHPVCVDNWLLNFSNRCPVCRYCIKQENESV
ncbi:hypothetical protein SLOPH_2300 [Spraguea lophii 42_110]|uniref:RING-type domain-containing protein n=1 Tax=Spraguea lophii (strain 42_110) TaxID=1358809 RepID=S7WDL9_SPRLO|nr:hypothetical protein SLOPH_2300 [Spraguea lophii 42_110]